jgi:hypothetical protein
MPTRSLWTKHPTQSVIRPRRGWSRKGRHFDKHPPKPSTLVVSLPPIDRGRDCSRDHERELQSTSYSRFIERLPSTRPYCWTMSLYTNCNSQASMRGARHTTLTPPHCPWFNPTEYASLAVSARLPATERGLRAEGAPISEDDIRASLETITADKCQLHEHALKLVQSTFQALRDH